MEKRKLKRTPNENPAGNMNTVLLSLEGKREGLQNANIGTAL